MLDSDNAKQPTILFIGSGLASAARTMAQEHGVRLVSLPPHPPVGSVIDTIARERPDVIIVRSAKFPAEVIKAANGVRLIAKHGVGTDSIDVATATTVGIPVSFTAGSNAQSVAEHALALMFAVARNIPSLDHAARRGGWNKAVGIELTGKRLGLIGFGAISRRLAELVVPLRMEVLVYDPLLSPRDVPSGIQKLDSLDAVVGEAEILSLHCPLTAETRNMIDANRIARMRDGAILINTARGGLVDEDSLADALSAGKLAGAGLDTLASEPPAADNPLWTATNLVVTPHVGADTNEARARVGLMVMRQALDALSGRLPEPWMLANPVVLEAA